MTHFGPVRRPWRFLLLSSALLLATAATTAGVKVIFGPETMAGLLSRTQKITKSFSASPTAMTSFKLQLINADGADHGPQSCDGLGLAKKVVCALGNVADALYVSTVRTDWVEVTLNGQKVVTKTEFNKNIAAIQKTVTAKPQNTLVFEYKAGLIASYFSARVLSESLTPPPADPIADFTYSTETGLGTLRLQVDGSRSTDPDGTISEYVWTFGDGQSATGRSQTHDFNQPGIYDVKLKVKDNTGATNEKVVRIDIRDSRPPAIVSAQLPQGTIYKKTLPASFQISVESDEILSSATINGQNLNIEGKQASGRLELPAGNQPLVLRIKDRWGNESMRESEVTVFHDNVKPVITLGRTDGPLTNSAQFLLPIRVADTSPLQIRVVQNGETVFTTHEADSDHVFALRTGPNKFEIYATDAAGNEADIARLNSVILDDKAPVLTRISPSDDDSSLSFYFEVASDEALASATLTIDGLTPTSLDLTDDKRNVAHFVDLPGAGSHQLVLRATDLAGNSGMVTWVHNSLIQPPVANFSVSATSMTAPTLVTFSADRSFAPVGYITNYEWTVDGQLAGSGSIYFFGFLFAQGGSYEIGLKVRDNAGQETFTSQVVTIQSYPLPIPVIDRGLEPPYRAKICFHHAKSKRDLYLRHRAFFDRSNENDDHIKRKHDGIPLHWAREKIADHLPSWSDIVSSLRRKGATYAHFESRGARHGIDLQFARAAFTRETRCPISGSRVFVTRIPGKRNDS